VWRVIYASVSLEAEARIKLPHHPNNNSNIRTQRKKKCAGFPRTPLAGFAFLANASRS